MSRWIALLLSFAAVLPAIPIHAAAPAATPFPTGALTIAGAPFAVPDVLDARALPDINGKIGIMLTLTPGAAKRLGEISAALVGKPLPIALDGRLLGGEVIRRPVTSGVIEIPGRWNLTDAEALARRISGRDPLPDDLGGE